MKSILELLLSILRVAKETRELELKKEAYELEISLLKQSLSEAKIHADSANEYAGKYFDAVSQLVPDPSMRWAIITFVNAKKKPNLLDPAYKSA